MVGLKAPVRADNPIVYLDIQINSEQGRSDELN